MPGVSRPLPIGVLISGQGTNLRAILQRCEDGQLDAVVRVVISNRSDAAGLQFGRERDIPTFVCTRADYPGRSEQQLAMRDLLLRHEIELVVLAGFDQLLGDEFLAPFRYRIINLHPSLLPAFGGGMHAARDALAYGVKVTGCTVHFVSADIEGADSGPIIVQEAVAVEEEDTETSLLDRIHAAEHRILPAAIQLVAENRLRVEGRRVHVLSKSWS